MRVLLAEDDEYLSSALSLALRRKGWDVHPARTGSAARDALAVENFDIVLLDLGLPDTEGTAILTEVRSAGAEFPVIVITARDGLDERIQNLDLGANDYLVKPFDVRELEARMRAALRQTLWKNKTQVKFGSLQLDTNTGTLTLKGQRMELTPKEAMILQMLMSRPGRAFAKRELMRQPNDWADEASENAVEIIVHRLRKKLEASDVSINTMRGFGYVLEKK